MSISEQENWSIKRKGGLQSQVLKRKRKKLPAMLLLGANESSTEEARFQTGSQEGYAHFSQARVRDRVEEKLNKYGFLTSLWNWWMSSQWALSPAVHVKMSVLRGQEIMAVLSGLYGPSRAHHRAGCFRNHQATCLLGIQYRLMNSSLRIEGKMHMLTW